MTFFVLGLVLGVGIIAVLLLKGFLDQTSARKEFSNDPVQARLADHVERYIYSAQDEAAYLRLAEATREAFGDLGVVSGERTLKRLMHAAAKNNEHVKSGLRKKPTPSQTLGAANALIRLSKEL